MRPDEHKKKKNAQYKKKHGMSTSTNEKKQTEPPQQTHHENVKRPTEPPKQQTDISKQSEEPAGKTFSRRKITSNWERYEIEETNEETGRQDFSTLLATATGGAVSKFRFKDEKMLDEDVAMGTTPSLALLTIDLTDLGEAVHCVPLHTRLGLEKELFQENQVRLFMEEASSNSLRYNRQPASTQGNNGVIEEKTVTKHSERIDNVLDDLLLIHTTDNIHDSKEEVQRDTHTTSDIYETPKTENSKELNECDKTDDDIDSELNELLGL